MKVFCVSMAIALFPLICHAEGNDPEIHVRDVGGGAYHLTFKSAVITDVSAAHYALIPTAQKLCAAKTPQYGHYKYDMQQMVSGPDAAANPKPVLVLDQDIICVAAADPAHPLAPDPNWRPTPADKASVSQLTYKYFTARDYADYRGAYAMLAQETQALLPFADWQSRAQKFNAQAGASQDRQIVQVSWQKDPANAPKPGVYASVDYVSKFENLAIHCGFLVWYQQPDGSFLLSREEENFVPKDQASKMGAATFAATKAKFQCAGE